MYEYSLFQVLEGERPLASQNTKLGQFDMGGIPLRPAGEVKIEVTFSLDEDSILHVTAVETSKGVSKALTIKNDKGTVSYTGSQNTIQYRKNFDHPCFISSNKCFLFTMII